MTVKKPENTPSKSFRSNNKVHTRTLINIKHAQLETNEQTQKML